MHSIGTWELWTIFISFVAIVLFMDMVVLGGKRTHIITSKEALRWTLIWFSCAMLFNLVLWLYLNQTSTPDIAHQKALEFFTGYIIEESLSVDNMFVFLMIFQYFSVPAEYQRRVLLYGVLGAMIMRLIMILFGSWLVIQLHWILYVFGAFLIFTGIKMVLASQDQQELSNNPILKWLQKHIRCTKTFHKEAFFIKQNAIWYATPLFLVLVMIELSDVLFALDSIPAIFAVTTDPFIVFTSNIFAIMGLRALYFLLVNLAARFYLLKYGIALILVFIGIKMVIEVWFPIPIVMALSIVVSILITTALLSLIKRKGTP